MRSMYIVALMTSGRRSWPRERLVLKLSNLFDGRKIKPAGGIWFVPHDQSLNEWCEGVRKHVLEAASHLPRSWIKRAPIEWVLNKILTKLSETVSRRIVFIECHVSFHAGRSLWYQQTSLTSWLWWRGAIQSDLDTCVFQSLGLAEQHQSLYSLHPCLSKTSGYIGMHDVSWKPSWAAGLVCQCEARKQKSLATNTYIHAYMHHACIHTYLMINGSKISVHRFIATMLFGMVIEWPHSSGNNEWPLNCKNWQL